MMIIEIALGIVLGVLILRYWPVIFALGTIAVIVGIVALLGSMAIYFIFTNEPIFRKLAEITILLAAILVGSFFARIISKRSVLTAGEAGVFLAMAFMLASATFIFVPFITKWSSETADSTLLLFLIPLAGLWGWIWLKFARLVRERKAKAQTSGSASQLFSNH